MSNKSHTKHKATAAAILAAVTALTGCSSPQLDKRSEDHLGKVIKSSAAVSGDGPTLAEQGGVAVRGGTLNNDSLAGTQRRPVVARRALGPYVSAGMVPVTTEDKLPRVFYEPYTLDFSDLSRGGKVPLTVAMQRLAKLTGVPVRVQSDVLSRPGGAAIANVAQRVASVTPMTGQPGSPMPSPVLANGAGPTSAPASTQQQVQSPPSDSLSQLEPPSIDSVDMKYSGTLAGYLNTIVDTLGLSWEYRDNTIVIQRFVTEIHEVAATIGNTKYSMSTSGSGQGSGGSSGASNSASASLEVSESGESNIIDSMLKTITGMVASSPGSTVTRVDGSGRIMVSTSKTLQGQVRDFVASENRALNRQASIQFDIYSVSTSDNDEHGINWQLALTKAGEAARLGTFSPASLTTAPAGSTSLTILPNVAGNKVSEMLANSSLILQALNQQGFSAQHRPVSILALNRRWGRSSRVQTDTYLSETTPGPASSTGVGAPGLKTDKVTTGDQYVAMPTILNDNTVLLKFGLSLSDLLALTDVSVGVGATAQKVQAPKVQAINAQFEVHVGPGEVVAVTGLSRRVASSDRRRLGEGAPLLAGGSSKTAVQREHFIIFVRPVLQ